MNLEEVVTALGGLHQLGKLGEAAADVDAFLEAELGRIKWAPNPGPQTEAYFSEADVLLYGGQPGGGKSILLLLLAYNCHRRSLIMRRKYGDLSRLVEDLLKIHGSRDGFNGSPPPKLRIDAERQVDFGAAHRVGDEQDFMGRGRDFLGIDEATHFAESQIRFLMGWNRTDIPGQRVRTVLATNPPLDPEGLWVIQMFAPWLDPTHPNPAKQGELRWVISDEEGKDEWVDGPGSVFRGGKEYKPMSRTYIEASVDDNPEYAESDYKRQLDAMPEPWRSLLMGGFKTAFQDKPNQVIPTEWVKAAQDRWASNPPDGIPMCAMGVDATGGGTDPMVIAVRHDGWFAPIIEIPAKELPPDRAGRKGAGIVVSYRRGNAEVVVDMSGGYGGPMYEQLVANDIPTFGYRGSAGSRERTKDGMLGFYNHRSQSIWRFREALDPDQDGGSRIMLPPDPKLVADLTAPTLDMTYDGIKVESKEDVCDRLGRSTDRGDAVVMAWSRGATMASHYGVWRTNAASGIRSHKPAPRAILGHQAARRR